MKTAAAACAAEDRLLSDRLYLAFLAFMVWIPLPMGSNRPWAWSILEVWVYVLAMAWIWGVQRGKLAVPDAFMASRPVLFMLFCWLAYGAIQLVPLPMPLISILSPVSARMHELAGNAGWAPLTVDFHASMTAWFKSLAYAIVFCLVMLMVTDRHRLERLAKVLVYSGLIQAFYGSMMTLSGLEFGFFIKKFAYLGAATGTFVNRNHFAGYLEMCLSIGMGLMIASLDTNAARGARQRLRKALALFLSEKMRLRLYLAVMVIALVLTHSRMGNTAFFASMMASGVLGLLLMKRAPRTMVLLIASLVAIDILIVGTWFGVEKVVARLEQTSAVHDADRVEVSERAWRQWNAYRLVGSGGGSFYSVFPEYRDSKILSYYDHAHNDYAEFLSEYGVLGAMLLAAIVLSSFLAALLALYKRRDPLMRGMAYASTMGILALSIHSVVDFNLQIPANAATFMVILALAWLSLNLKS